MRCFPRQPPPVTLELNHFEFQLDYLAWLWKTSDQILASTSPVLDSLTVQCAQFAILTSLQVDGDILGQRPHQETDLKQGALFNFCFCRRILFFPCFMALQNRKKQRGSGKKKSLKLQDSIGTNTAVGGHGCFQEFALRYHTGRRQNSSQLCVPPIITRGDVSRSRITLQAILISPMQGSFVPKDKCFIPVLALLKGQSSNLPA